MDPKGYTDKEAIEDYLLQSIDPSFESRLDEWIAAVEQYIDNETGRNFIADETTSARLFEGKPSNKLLIDDCVAVTVVEQGDTYGESFSTIVGADYQLLPYNDTPKNAIGLKRTLWGLGVHRITAKWGYSVEAPADIKMAATVLVGGIIWGQIYPDGIKKSEEIGNYKVSFKDEKADADYDRAIAALSQYRRISI